MITKCVLAQTRDDNRHVSNRRGRGGGRGEKKERKKKKKKRKKKEKKEEVVNVKENPSSPNKRNSATNELFIVGYGFLCRGRNLLHDL